MLDLQSSNIETLLAFAGATEPSRLTGKFGRTATFFPQLPQKPATAPLTFDARHLTVFETVPLAYLTALKFAYHDISCPVEIDDRAFDEVPAYCSRGETELKNLRSGALTLGSVYGNTGLTGDFCETLNDAMRRPWDLAKLWVDNAPHAPAKGDILRLHRLITTSDAVLNERSFQVLPDHLKDLFFADGDLLAHRPIVPDLRNDQSLLLSQFHFAVASRHARCVDRLDRDEKSDRRGTVFCQAREIVQTAFVSALVRDVLPRLCDPQSLRWSLGNKTRLYQDAQNGKRHTTLPLEAIAVFDCLFDICEPARLVPNYASLQEGRALSHEDTHAEPGQHLLPNAMFISQRIPTRIAEKNTIDWALFLDGAPPAAQTLRINGRFAKPVESDMIGLRLASGQDCVVSLQKRFGLPLPLLSTEDVAATLNCAPHDGGTPLPLYVLAEAERYGRQGRLGPLGSMIVTETILGAARDTLDNVWDNTLSNFLGVNE